MPNSPTQHFAGYELIDYVRGVAAPALEAAIQEHLQVQGCAQCLQAANTLAEAYRTGQALAKVTVPDRVMARAAAIFQPEEMRAERAAAEELPSNWRQLPRLAAELLWAGGAAPAMGYRGAGPAQARSGGMEQYSGHGVQVRLAVEPNAEGGKLLFGAIAEDGNPDRPCGGLLLWVVANDKPMVTTRTSRQGEFQLQLPNQNKLSLLVFVPTKSRLLEIPLAGFLRS